MDFAKCSHALVAVLAASWLLSGCQAHQSGGQSTSVGQLTASRLVGGRSGGGGELIGTEKIRRPLESQPDWRSYFEDIRQGGILVSIDGRTLHYWGPNGENYASYLIAVPRGPEFERYGPTEVIRKREQPDWRPTPDMLARRPELPEYVGPGPKNPMGEHAMYLSWKYYAIHGTNNPRSIGRRATEGCIRMHPDDIATLFAKTSIGTPVQVVQRVQPTIGREAPHNAPPRVLDDSVADSGAPRVEVATLSGFGADTYNSLNASETR